MVAEPKETEALPAVHSRPGLVPSNSNRYRSRHQRLRPWSVAATATITCFSEMDVDRAGALRRRGTDGAGGAAASARIGSYHGALGDSSSSAAGSSRGETFKQIKIPSFAFLLVTFVFDTFDTLLLLHVSCLALASKRWHKWPSKNNGSQAKNHDYR